MANKIKEFLLNTPEHHWVIIRGCHFHKSFWGTLLIAIGIIILIFYSQTLAIILFVLGIILIMLSILGHRYTNNRPYFKLWEKHKK